MASLPPASRAVIGMEGSTVLTESDTAASCVVQSPADPAPGLMSDGLSTLTSTRGSVVMCTEPSPELAGDLQDL